MSTSRRANGCGKSPGVASPRNGILLYDGDCRLCSTWAPRWARIAAPDAECAPYQTAIERFPDLSAEACAREVQWIDPDGTVSGGADAVLRSMSARGWGRAVASVVRGLPGARPLARRLYRLLADHRPARRAPDR